MKALFNIEMLAAKMQYTLIAFVFSMLFLIPTSACLIDYEQVYHSCSSGENLRDDENDIATTCKSESKLVVYRNLVEGCEANAAKGASSFFQGAKYSPKVLNQMNKVDDIFHAFPKSVDGFATKFGKWSTKVGADGKTYEWLEMPGSYGGKTGVFEYTKGSNGLINHRFFNVPKIP
jgi:hypothetical protein